MRLSNVRHPVGDTVLVHGDLHLGNTLWVGAYLTGIVDWDAARVGSQCIDLGLARFDAVLRARVPSLDLGAVADAVLHGWQLKTGEVPARSTLAYWDLRAALNAPVDFGPPPEKQPLRRDAFVESALSRL